MSYDFFLWGRRPDAADVRAAVAELAGLGIFLVLQGELGEGYLPVALRVADGAAFAGAQTFVAAGVVYTGCECLVREGREGCLTVLAASEWAMSPLAELVCAAFLGAALAKVVGGVLEDPQSNRRLDGAVALDLVAALAEDAAGLASPALDPPSRKAGA